MNLNIKKDKIYEVKIDILKEFHGHPFKVTDNEDMEKLKESISKYGLISPIIARPVGDGTLEIVSGHRRCAACKALGMETINVIVKELDDDQAIISMVDANLQRETILPSEKAYAYKMKMEAMSHQGKQTEKTSDQVGPKLTVEEISDKDSATQVKRYIRLTKLVPELLQMVDDKKIAFNVAVQLSYLPEDKQKVLFDAIGYEDKTPSLSQANEMKKKCEAGELTDTDIHDILKAVKPSEKEYIKVPIEDIQCYFKDGATPQYMQKILMESIDFYAHYKIDRNKVDRERNRANQEAIAEKVREISRAMDYER